MPNDSALITVLLLPSNFPNRQAFVRAATKEAKAQAERVWKNHPARKHQGRGRPSEQNPIEDVIVEAINEMFWAKADILRKGANAKEKRKALKELGDLSQRKLINSVRGKLEARNPKDGRTATPHEDTIYKYVKGDRLFNRTDPDKLTVDQAKWLAKHQPGRAKSVLQLARIWKRHQIPETILKALSTAEVSPPKK
jgi:hypothetical protein